MCLNISKASTVRPDRASSSARIRSAGGDCIAAIRRTEVARIESMSGVHKQQKYARHAGVEAVSAGTAETLNEIAIRSRGPECGWTQCVSQLGKKITIPAWGAIRT